jgi:hypothetical protein
MTPDDKMEPIRDEYGGVWQFYKGEIPGINNEQYSYTLQLPAEIHNYIVDRYIGTDEQGPLPDNFSFTPQMMEDITQQWKTMGDEWPLDMATFRAAVEETRNHRYHVEASEHPFNDLVEQRESVMNKPLDDIDWFQAFEESTPLLDEKGHPIDIEEVSQAIDEGRLGDIGPEDGDAFVRQDLLEPASLNFGQVKDVADHMREKAGGLEQTINNDMDTFGR